MATQEQRERLRADIGATVDSLSDVDANKIYTEAGEMYADAASVKAAARVIAIRRIRANAAKMVTYKQNQTTMNASDVFKHLTALLESWERVLDKAVEEALTSGAARFGGLRTANRITEWPDS